MIGPEMQVEHYNSDYEKLEEGEGSLFPRRMLG